MGTGAPQRLVSVEESTGQSFYFLLRGKVKPGTSAPGLPLLTLPERPLNQISRLMAHSSEGHSSAVLVVPIPLKRGAQSGEFNQTEADQERRSKEFVNLPSMLIHGGGDSK